MSGRIRTIKPELLEDAVTAGLSDRAFRVFIACIVLADDYGGLRFEPGWLKAQIFWAHDVSPDDFERSLLELSPLIRTYEVSGQRYALIRNWSKHQKVSHPGKPRIPSPPETLEKPSGEPPETLVPDLRSPTKDHRPREGAHARATLDEPIPDKFRERAKSLAEASGAPELDIGDSWRGYLAWCVENNFATNEARWARWVNDDARKRKSERVRQRERDLKFDKARAQGPPEPIRETPEQAKHFAAELGRRIAARKAKQQGAT